MLAILNPTLLNRIVVSGGIAYDLNYSLTPGIHPVNDVQAMERAFTALYNRCLELSTEHGDDLYWGIIDCYDGAVPSEWDVANILDQILSDAAYHNG